MYQQVNLIVGTDNAEEILWSMQQEVLYNKLQANKTASVSDVVV